MTTANDHDANHRGARPTRAHKAIARVLLGQIFRGELAAGAKLPTERAQARAFAANRATVREALRYLETLELIAVRQGDGAYVRDFLKSGNLQVAKEMIEVDMDLRREILAALLEVRRNYLPAVAYAAALRRTPAQLRQLEKAIRRNPETTVMARDRRVHRIIARSSGNVLNILLINFFEDFFDAFGPVYFDNPRHRRRSEQFHHDIHTAIAQQNAGQSRDIMHEVLLYAENALLEGVDEHPRGV
ncbi:MAG: GntR family transcriptional regulator [Desulfobacterales bacterium]|nr:GntR family transcriptional regulator [Desulfobacterales bacterium]